MTDTIYKDGIQAFERARKFEAIASTHEDLVYVEQDYWKAYTKLIDSPNGEHRNICIVCLKAIASILDGEGRHTAANELRNKAQKLVS